MSPSRYWSVWGLAGLLLGSVYLYDATREPAPGPLLGLAPEAVETLELITRQGSSQRYRREQGQWRGPEGAIDAQALAPLLALGEAPVVRWLPAEADAATLGFTPPWARVRLNDRMVEIGDVHAFEPLRYARGLHPRTPIALIPDTLSLVLAQPERLNARHAGTP